MANAVLMYDALGHPPEHPHRAIARRAIDKLLVIREDEAYCQPCVSPVWDTALAAHALIDVGSEEAVAAARRGLGWLLPLQELEVKGDWAERRPEVRPGGWAFQYRNAHYPDLDDTAVVVMARDRARREFAAGDRYDEAVSRGAEWTVGLQSRNGGWGAFDADNVDHYLNNIPFADHGALLDPPTADVSARCVSMMAQLGETADNPAMRTGLDYLRREQAADGSWFGRWGVKLCLWHVVGALRAERGRPRRGRSVRAQGSRLVDRHPEPGRRWGEDLRQLQARLSRLRTRAVQRVTDSLGASGIDGGRRSGPPCRGAWHRVPPAHPGRDRPVAAGRLYRRRFPARLLSALSRLPGVLPAVGPGALSQSQARQCPACAPRHVMILAATGLQRERRIVAGPDIEAIASGGDPVRLEAVLDRLASTASGIISIGIAGALAAGLPVGQWVVADAVLVDGESLSTDPAWTNRLAARLPEAARGSCSA